MNWSLTKRRDRHVLPQPLAPSITTFASCLEDIVTARRWV